MNKVQIQIIKDAMDNPELLTEWENDFIDDIAEYENDQVLTEKQNSIVNRIGSKVA